MVTVVYPGNLPQFSQLGGRDQLADNLVVNEMETGPPQTRRRNTLVFSPLDVPFRVKTATKEDIETFYNDTLANGSLEFQKVDFLEPGGTTFVYKFRSPPSFDWMGGEIWTTTFQLWKIREA